MKKITITGWIYENEISFYHNEDSDEIIAVDNENGEIVYADDYYSFMESDYLHAGIVYEKIAYCDTCQSSVHEKEIWYIDGYGYCSYDCMLKHDENVKLFGGFLMPVRAC